MWSNKFLYYIYLQDCSLYDTQITMACMMITVKPPVGLGRIKFLYSIQCRLQYWHSWYSKM